jgi:hypothetical protein
MSNEWEYSVDSTGEKSDVESTIRSRIFMWGYTGDYSPPVSPLVGLVPFVVLFFILYSVGVMVGETILSLSEIMFFSFLIMTLSVSIYISLITLYDYPNVDRDFYIYMFGQCKIPFYTWLISLSLEFISVTLLGM